MKINPLLFRTYWFHAIPQKFQFTCRRWASKHLKGNSNTWIVSENDIKKYSLEYKRQGESDLYMINQQHERSQVRYNKLPLHESVKQGISVNFPEIKYFTPVQIRILRAALMNRFPFMVRAWNGSVMSFYYQFLDKFTNETEHGCQVLIVVPNKNLAQQYQAWIEKLATGEPMQEPLQKISQILEVSLFGLEAIKRDLPFLLIADYKDLERLKGLNHPILDHILPNLKTIIFDESDLYIPTEGRQRRLAAPEPRIAATSLSSFIQLCRERSLSSRINKELSEVERQKKMKSGSWLPNLIFLSATNSYPCADFVGKKITNQLGIIGIHRKIPPYWNFNSTQKIQHLLIEVTKDQRTGSLRLEDIQYEYARNPNYYLSVGDSPLSYENIEVSADMFVESVRKTLAELYKDYRSRYAPRKNIFITIPREFDPSWFCKRYQRIGTTPLRSFECYPLKGEAIPESHKQKQIAYVVNASETRGLYVPEVGHVFHLWSTLSAASYLNISGRISYLNREGLVLNYLLPGFLKSRDFQKLNCSRSALLVLQRVGIRPKQFFET
ncbi:mitochondrial ATP-dependent RNA helicase Mrh5 [Schizosaccharomyces osmophilus]|uniref:Mitochondrial ATP-dependent RNA helicase Mrh5 n=1 Tax=Schizosaccharomyces osmophilus TaxID=2545709 RepID=A0AAF0ATN5_9SCHI|nr:mitochondrial ATP-dependent RNA helicase Mrh5 [Schizosaccharomyces osmophilus]WBW71626.1 mitochondrial ATP-dependent RNA helicase Mrh5 [Schizosaccharomyces osmophilus]